jgi:hypothetical protein
MRWNPLRAETSRLRKQKKLSLDGTVPGIEYNRARGDYVSVPLAGNVDGARIPADYMGPMPQDYTPHPGRMDIQQPMYEGYQPAGPGPTPTLPPEQFAQARTASESMAEVHDLGMMNAEVQAAQQDMNGAYDASAMAADHAEMARMSQASLEAMVQGHAVEEINAAIDQAAEPLPAPQQENPLEDPQLQQLMNPFGPMM